MAEENDDKSPAQADEKRRGVGKLVSFSDETATNGDYAAVLREDESKAEDDMPHQAESSPRTSTRRSSLRRVTDRPDHLQSSDQHKRASFAYSDKIVQGVEAADEDDLPGSLHGILTPSTMERIREEASALKIIDRFTSQLYEHIPQDHDGVEVRITNLNYRVKYDPFVNKIQTVYNQSVLYIAHKFIKRLLKLEKWPEKKRKYVLQDVTLNFEPGKMYLLLGPPGAGKTTLLKAVSARLSTNGKELDGSILYNGLCFHGRSDLFTRNIASYVGELDFHAPRLTVKETFDFAFQCKSGGTHAAKELVKTDAAREAIAKMDAEGTLVACVTQILGLAHVEDTFVGNSEEVRGVSGGQRRRVTFGEMIQSFPMPLICADEISNGLDAASIFDIISVVARANRVSKSTRIISLLQPSPETVALFDEVIVLAEGRVIYAGPVLAVEDYFARLGYRSPDFMDVADVLQILATPDGAALYDPSEDELLSSVPYTLAELAEIFRQSDEFESIQEKQREPWDSAWGLTDSERITTTATTAKLKRKYANSCWRSMNLNLRRNIVIWSRDKRFLIANAAKNLIMGVSVGGVFYQTDSVISLYGVLFQLNLFIMLGAMTSVPEQINDRIVYYRHADDNFYGSFAYAFAKGASLLPQSLVDVLIFGTICYFMVGLEVTASNYFIYISILFVFSITMNQQIGIFTTILSTKGAVQAASSGLRFFHLVFCGFIVPPSVIPNFYHWIYWWVPSSWSYRALLVNEFTSADWDWNVEGTDFTYGQLALIQGGFVYKGEPASSEWIGWAFAYLVPYVFLCTCIAGLCLRFVRVEPRGSPSPTEDAASEESSRTRGDSVVEGKNVGAGGSSAVLKQGGTNGEEEPANEGSNFGSVEGGHGSEVAGAEETDALEGEEEFDIQFVPVTLSFSDICYDVIASKGKENIRLLNNVYGMFEAGRMCALMGSSGAGKTTLMDVIALRKTSGTILGDVRLNGFEQEYMTFRRCSGYVEQFDVQQPELTVRETLLFSARLRLNSQDRALSDDDAKQRFVDHVLGTLELSSLSGCAVGIDGEGGLSFEQRKRLSIAVEVAASPSIIFLDEPTSGLDARAALLVVKTLRKIADHGRTVVATIHQPSSAVFEMFDDLLLLKKGGRMVFFGELGVESRYLVEYFESRGAKPINRGENPANWMLSEINQNDMDYAAEFLTSLEYGQLTAKVQAAIDERDASMEIKFGQEFAAPAHDRRKFVVQRLRTIYWRSPAYNLTRMLISLFLAFILGSIFFPVRNKAVFTEVEMTTVINTIFISFISVGVLTINSVLPVTLQIRDNFYRHRAAGLVDHGTVALGLGLAEQGFIVVSAFLFCVVFLSTMGLTNSVGRGFAFWGFFCFNTAIYSFFGQAFVACVPTVPTSQILAAVFIGLNNFFSGLIVRPQYLSGFFTIPYWITPGHYVFEGMVMALFSENETPVVATPGTNFYDTVCLDELAGEPCTGTVDEFMQVFFGGWFSRDHILYNTIILGVYLVLARVATCFGLKYFNYMNKE